MDISKLSVEQLKAMAYDLIAQKEQVERNLAIVNQEILKRMNPAVGTSKEEIPRSKKR